MNDGLVYTKRFKYFLAVSGGIFGVLLVGIYFSSIKATFFEKKIVFNALSQVTLEAKSVYILDTTRDEVIFEKNATEIKPIASITKIMTAIVALDLWQRGDILSATLPNAFYVDGMVQNILLEEKWSVNELVKLMLTKSSNEAGEAFRQFGTQNGINFIEKMNQKGRELGLWKAEFKNSTGLDINPKTAGAYATAEEVAFLLKYALKTYPDIFEPTRLKGYNTKSEEGTDYFIENTNQLAPYLKGLIASKTGYTELAGGNLVFALKVPFKDKTRMVIVALLGSTKEGRFRDAESITQALLIDYKNNL